MLNYMNNEKEYKYGYVWDNDYGNIVVEFFYPKKAKEWYNYEMSIYHEPYLYTTDEELINLIGKDNYKYITDDDYVDKFFPKYPFETKPAVERMKEARKYYEASRSI